MAESAAQTVMCDDCGDHVVAWDWTEDGYVVCESCWNHRVQEADARAEVDVGEQEEDFAAEEDEEESVGNEEAWWVADDVIMDEE